MRNVSKRRKLITGFEDKLFNKQRTRPSIQPRYFLGTYSVMGTGVTYVQAFRPLRLEPKRLKKNGRLSESVVFVVCLRYPGAMISAQFGNSVSAGIFVEKVGEIHLTVAFYCRDNEKQKESKIFGDPNGL